MKRGLSFVLLMLLVCGCAHSRRAEQRARAEAMLDVPAPPAFLSGPMAVLLTNANGFSARAFAETTSLAGRPELVSGELLGRGSKLLFAPDAKTYVDKRTRAAGISFIWDVHESSGYMLSEAMQGYAPVSFNLRFTNMTVAADSPASETVEGHRCGRQFVTLTASDGSTAAFRVWRAADLQGFPVRIAAATNTLPVTLNLSRIRLAPPPEELFRPPAAFTKYESAEGMIAEMAMRQQNLKRRSTSSWSDLDSYGTSPEPRPR